MDARLITEFEAEPSTERCLCLERVADINVEAMSHFTGVNGGQQLFISDGRANKGSIFCLMVRRARWHMRGR